MKSGLLGFVKFDCTVFFLIQLGSIEGKFVCARKQLKARNEIMTICKTTRAQLRGIKQPQYKQIFQQGDKTSTIETEISPTISTETQKPKCNNQT